MDQQLPESASSSTSSPVQRTNDNQTQNQRISPPNPPPPCLAYRVLIIPNRYEIVGALSATATRYGQAFYVGHGTGYISQGSCIPLAQRSGHIQFHNGRAEIVYFSGWFHPMLTYQNRPIVPANHSILPPRLGNGVLYVCLRHERVPQGVSLATSLIASEPVEVSVLFVCQPGSIVQPYEAGGPREQYIIHVQPY